MAVEIFFLLVSATMARLIYMETDTSIYVAATFGLLIFGVVIANLRLAEILSLLKKENKNEN